MSRLLIGSSNVYRTYKAPAFKHYPEYAMIRCVEFEILSAQLTNLDPEEKEVTISVLENFMVKAASNLEGKEREEGRGSTRGGNFPKMAKCTFFATHSRTQLSICSLIQVHH